MKSKQKIVDDYILKLLQDAGLKGDNLTKHLIIHKAFLKEVKPFTSKLTTEELKGLTSSFQMMIIQFETICIRAYSPLSGSQSTARDIISMYSSNSLEFSLIPKKICK